MANGKITVEVNVTISPEEPKTPALPEGFFTKFYEDSPYSDEFLSSLRESLRKDLSPQEETPEELPELTLEEARGYLARAVLTKGADFVYLPSMESKYVVGEVGQPSCSYFCRTDLPETDPRHDTPCLVGVVMKLAGRTILAEQEGRIPTNPEIQEAWNLTVQAAEYLRIAQSQQDNRRTWGHAYASAERYAENFLRAESEYVDSKAARALI